MSDASAVALVAEGRQSPTTKLRLQFTPEIGPLVSDAEVQRYAAEQKLEIQEHQGALGAVAFGRVTALQFNIEVLLEAAFQRIAQDGAHITELTAQLGDLENRLLRYEAMVAPPRGKAR